MLWMQNTYHYSFRANQSLLGYHVYHQIVGRFLSLCSESKARDIIFHLREKKIYAEEVTFALKIFPTGKSLIRPGRENDLIKSCFNSL